MKCAGIVVSLLASGMAAAAAPYPSLLPPDAVVRTALSQAPMITAAQQQVNQGLARERKLRAGTYEWEVAATTQERKDQTGAKFAEQQYELTRRWRLPGKGGLDRRIGALAAAVGEFAYADAWHEAGRGLLAGWFDWLRESRSTALLQEQAALAAKQLEAITRRVAAGDAPRLDRQLAEAELGRVVALQLEAARRAESARIALLQDFPLLSLQAPSRLDEPVTLDGSDEQWIQQVVNENHEIELAQGRADEAQLAAVRAGRDRIADPTVGLHFSNNIDQNRNVIGLRIAIPIGLAARGAEAAMARSTAAVAAAEAIQARHSVEGAAQRDVLNARSSYRQWERLADVARQSQAAAESVARAYAAGELGVSELLAARRQSLDAQLLATVSLLTAHESQARLQLDAHQLWALDEHEPHH